MKLYKEQVEKMKRSASFSSMFDNDGFGYSGKKMAVKMAKYSLGFCILFPTFCAVAIPLVAVSMMHGALSYVAKFVLGACNECECGVRLLCRLRKTDIENPETFNKKAD